MQPRYYPLHWRQSRPYGKSLADTAKQAAARGGFDAASKAMLTELSDAAARAGRPIRTLMEGEFLSRELMVSQTVAQFELDGGSILDFSSPLVEALRHSDTGEMRLADVVEPSRSYYLHFGAQPDWLLNGRWPLEGVLVNHFNGNLRLLLVGRSTGQSWVRPEAHEHYMLRMPDAGCSMVPFDEAIQMAVDIDVNDIRHARAVMAARPELTALPGSLDSFDAALRAHELNRGVVVGALKLLGNALAYVSAYPEDCVQQWQPGTPEAMAIKAGRAGKEGANAASKLFSMGYRMVRRIGEQFEVASDAAEEHGLGHGGGGGAKSPHWRTGHWRNQPHGPHMSLRKLIWIRPMRILGGG